MGFAKSSGPTPKAPVKPVAHPLTEQTRAPKPAPGAGVDTSRLSPSLHSMSQSVDPTDPIATTPGLDSPHLARKPVELEVASTGTIAGVSRAEFLDELRRAVLLAADTELAGTDWTAEGCPWIEYWLSYYGTRSAEHIEAAMRRFAPAANRAVTADEYIAPAITRVREAIRTWRQTGAIRVPFDGIEGSNLGADGIRAELGESRPLDSQVRTRMEQGFGQPIPTARVHTGPAAVRYAREHDARAVTIGTSIGFAESQFRPGTTRGDLLIAHELAHVVQQSSASRFAPHSDARSDEAHADVAAATAVARIGGGKQLRPLLPRTSGLALRRCDMKNEFDDEHSLDDVRMGETKQQAWLRQFRRTYPQYENIDWDPAHSRDPGIDTDSGVRVPQDPKNFLTPRVAYEHRDAAFLAYQGDIHLAELFEARHPSVATLTAAAQGRTIRDKDLNLRSYVKWAGRAKASAEGVQVGLMFADVVMLGKAVYAGRRAASAARAVEGAEAAEARAAAGEGKAAAGEAEATAKPMEEGAPNMHNGKEAIAESKATIAGEKHEVVATREPSGPPRARMCSRSCDFVVNSLKQTRDQLPPSAPPKARALLDELIAEGQAIDKDLAAGADRAGRQEWRPRLDDYADRLSAAAQKYPKEIGDPLKTILNGEPLKMPGDEAYTGGTKPNSWRLTDDGMGAHLFERSNVKGRPALSKFDQPGTPRYFPAGTPENAGQAHLRIHDATAKAGINLGSSPLTDDAIINAYKKAYSDASLGGIKGELRIPGGKTLASGVTPGQAFEDLLEWAGF